MPTLFRRQRILGLAALCLATHAHAQAHVTAVDPGVRLGVPGAGSPLGSASAVDLQYYNDGLARFVTVESVTGSTNNGLGPRFNSNQCSSCHSYPAIGGSSPRSNPLVAVANANGATNTLPWFITSAGPVREVRFKTNPDGTADGGVHDLFVISGRSDAQGCAIAQPNFLPAGNAVTGQGGNPNLAFRIPTPTFGAGLIEAIPDAAILANMQNDLAAKARLGIAGHPNAHLAGTANRSGNDGTITRFGWKAQNPSLLMFSGEAYNVEMGVTNQLFPQERDQTPGCLFNPTPEDATNFGASPDTAVLSDIEAFSNFMRMLAAPVPAQDTPSTIAGRAAFVTIGCAECHTPALPIGNPPPAGRSRPQRPTPPPGQLVPLYSDLIVHHMGTGLADGITQGSAGPDEFRTAPLWGVGQRVYFLHDGRTSDLVQAIEAHLGPGSEANQVVEQFNQASPGDQQNIVNFLRGL